MSKVRIFRGNMGSLRKYTYFRKYILWALRIADRPLRPLLEMRENSLQNRIPNSHGQHRPVFIIGAPRSGSTLLYQAITNCLNVSYIDNIAGSFPRNLLAGMEISRRLFAERPHECYRSWLGSTDIYSLHAPAECGAFWYNYIPIEYGYLTEELAASLDYEEFGRVVTSICNCFAQPFVHKNLYGSLRLNFLNLAVPNALYIVIKRDPCQTAKSILRARISLHGDEREWFSVRPERIDELAKLPVPDQIIHQIHQIERQIMKDCRSLGLDHRMIWINYEDFLEKPQREVSHIADFIGAQIRSDELSKLASIIMPPDSKKATTSRYFQEFKEIAGSLTWQQGFTAPYEEKPTE